MNIALLLMAAFGCTVQSVCKKEFSVRSGRGLYFYSAVGTFVAMLFFAAVQAADGTFSYDRTTFWYSLAFSACHATSIVCGTLLFRYGPFGISNLIISYSLLLPTLYGIIKGEPVTFPLIVGILLFALALFLTNYKKQDAGTDKKANFKWLIFMILAFVANGFCSIVQKAEGLALREIYGDRGESFSGPFMIVALAIGSFSLFILSLITESREDRREMIRKTLWLDVFSGGMNGMVNQFVILLNADGFPASVMFPVISGLGIVLAFFLSLLYYKEKFTKMQVWGFAVGLVSIVILNITNEIDAWLQPVYAAILSIF